MKTIYLFVFQLLLVTNLSAQIWSQIHDLGLSETGYEINALSDDNLLISGKEWGFENNASKYMFVKMNPEGEVLWNKVYQIGNGGSSYSNIYTFELSEQKGFFVIGTTYEAISTESFGDVFFLRLDEHGDSLWTQTMGTGHVESLRAAFMTEEEDFVFQHNTSSPITGDAIYYLTKVDIEGNTIWEHELSINGTSVFHSLIPTPDDGFIISGYKIPSINIYDALAVKIDSEGNTSWEKTYGGMWRDFFFDLEINKNGNPQFFGTTNSFSPQGFYVVETDWNGNLLSEKVIESPNGGALVGLHPRMEVLKLTDNGFLIITDGKLGSCEDDDTQLYRLDANGDYLSNVIFGTPTVYESMYNAVQCPDGNIFLVGGYYDWGPETDLMILKYANDAITNTVDLNIENIELKVFPNPMKESFNLEIPESIELPLNVEILDVSGKVLLERRIEGYNRNITLGHLNNGIYFAKVYHEGFMKTLKFVKE